jgi:hypothetical protein
VGVIAGCLVKVNSHSGTKVRICKQVLWNARPIMLLFERPPCNGLQVIDRAGLERFKTPGFKLVAAVGNTSVILPASKVAML